MSGIPFDWAATKDKPGVDLLPDLSVATADLLAERIGSSRRPGDLVVLSIHWGPNWRFEVSNDEQDFAHRLIDSGAIDVLHGHSSHHVKGVEVYRGKLVLYGCGDFLDDYEGIGGHESFRGDLGLVYLPSFEANGELASLELVPTTVRRFQVRRADPEGAAWLQETLQREGRRFGTSAWLDGEGRLRLRWG
jgi:poly-gamma-glutamate synthesis protein (capsule biosynthesis protein)